MITAPTVSLKGEAEEKTKLPEAIFGATVSPQLLVQAVRVYLFNQRRAQAKTKTRGEVAKTTAKMYRQKGTGRARHGAYSAPIFVGGGVAHGPSGQQNYQRKMSKPLSRLALIGALAEKAKNKNVTVVMGAEKASGKTKEAEKLMASFKEKKGRTLVVLAHNDDKFGRGIKNLPGVETLEANQINTYRILACKKLLINQKALEEIGKTYAS